MLDTLTSLLQPWADFYAEQTALSTAIIAVHVLGIVVGGGVAIAADRRVLQATPGTAEAHRAVADDLAAQHGLVIGTLAIVVLSGLALVTADLATFAVSRVYWAKMATFAALLVNGWLMRRAETAVATAARTTVELSIVGPDLTLPWSALRRSAWVSLAGWCLTVLLGVVVSNS